MGALTKSRSVYIQQKQCIVLSDDDALFGNKASRGDYYGINSLVVSGRKPTFFRDMLTTNAMYPFLTQIKSIKIEIYYIIRL